MLATPSAQGPGWRACINWAVGVIFNQRCLRVQENARGRINRNRDGEGKGKGKGWARLVS